MTFPAGQYTHGGNDMPDVHTSSNRAAFLGTIAFSELGALCELPQADRGYRIIVGSTTQRPILLGSYARHPCVAVATRYGWSDAAGRYQIMAAIDGLIRTDTWDWCSRAAGVDDFSPAAQDVVAIELIRRRGALDDVDAGRFDAAATKCAAEWASLPGAGYGQHENALAVLRSKYVGLGGELA